MDVDIEDYIGKGSWNIEDVEKLITSKVEENARLEYKRGIWLTNDENGRFNLRKWVSSFANSAGGLLIIGVNEIEIRENGHVKKRIPDKIDALDFSIFGEGPKKWIDDVLSNGIYPPFHPTPRIYQVNADGETSKGIIIVDVSESSVGPHKIRKNNRDYWFSRLNFQVREMDEWEVKKLIFRSSPSPILSLRVDKSFVGSTSSRGVDSVGMDMVLENEGWVPGRSIQIGFVVPSPPLSLKIEEGEIGRMSKFQKFSLPKNLANRFYMKVARISVDSRVYHDLILHPLDDVRFQVIINVKELESRCCLIGGYLFAENMSPKFFSLKIDFNDKKNIESTHIEFQDESKPIFISCIN